MVSLSNLDSSWASSFFKLFFRFRGWGYLLDASIYAFSATFEGPLDYYFELFYTIFYYLRLPYFPKALVLTLLDPTDSS